MLPSPLMSPNIFRTVAVDPFGTPGNPASVQAADGQTPGAGGMMPLPNAPCTTITVPAACGSRKPAVICGGGPAEMDQSGTVSRADPSNVVISAYEAGTAPAVAHRPLIELTFTVDAFTPGLAWSHATEAPTGAVNLIGPSVAGSIATTRPACPTSCCISSVAPRTPLCISVRFQIVCCCCDDCLSAVITTPMTTRSTSVATSSSISEKPCSLRGFIGVASLEL